MALDKTEKKNQIRNLVMENMLSNGLGYNVAELKCERKRKSWMVKNYATNIFR